jgi:hypothetical protein
VPAAAVGGGLAVAGSVNAANAVGNIIKITGSSGGAKPPSTEGAKGGANPAQDKKLSAGEAKKLAAAGYHPHDLKPQKKGAHFDLYKTPNGDIVVKPKGGRGEGDPRGININDL